MNRSSGSLSDKETQTTDKRPTALIPAYNPEPLLPDLVQRLRESGAFQTVVVVNDGSDAEHGAVFAPLEADDKTVVLTHSRNRGKGATLKTGFGYIAENMPQTAGAVTIDADGQHSPQDAVRIALELAQNPNELVLGVREFGPEVPLRSRVGNILTRWIFRFVAGKKLTDTQTGLRGVPIGMFRDLIKLSSNGYEFELDMLLSCKGTGREIREIGIATVYINNNRSSHFNPLWDSMRIYYVLLRFSLSSIFTALLDNAVFAAVYTVYPSVAGSQVAGRIAGVLFNYFANKELVFHSKQALRRTLPMYLGLVVFSGILSYSVLLLIHHLTGIGVVLSKIIAETVIFFFNFIVQRDLIFLEKDVLSEDSNTEQ